MEKVATEEAVWQTCTQLEAENRKITGRAVKREIGGSLDTIYKYIDSWKAKNGTVLDGEIPAELQKSVLLALDQSAKKAVAELNLKLEEANERIAELLEELSASGQRIADLEGKLSDTLTETAELQWLREKESAVAGEAISNLREQIAKLDSERSDHISSRETAKAEVAKVLLQLERADTLTEKNEHKIAKLEKLMESVNQARSEADKQLAVALSQMAAMDIRSSETTATIATLESEKSALIHDLNIASAEYQRATAIAEQLQLRLQESGDANTNLRHELENIRKEAASNAERMIARIQENETTVHQLRNALKHARRHLSKGKPVREKTPEGGFPNNNVHSTDAASCA